MNSTSSFDSSFKALNQNLQPLEEILPKKTEATAESQAGKTEGLTKRTAFEKFKEIFSKPKDLTLDGKEGQLKDSVTKAYASLVDIEKNISDITQKLDQTTEPEEKAPLKEELKEAYKQWNKVDGTIRELRTELKGTKVMQRIRLDSAKADPKAALLRNSKDFDAIAHRIDKRFQSLDFVVEARQSIKSIDAEASKAVNALRNPFSSQKPGDRAASIGILLECKAKLEKVSENNAGLKDITQEAQETSKGISAAIEDALKDDKSGVSRKTILKFAGKASLFLQDEGERIAAKLSELPKKPGDKLPPALAKQLIELKNDFDTEKETYKTDDQPVDKAKEAINKAFVSALDFKPELRDAMFAYRNDRNNTKEQEALKKEIAFLGNSDQDKLFLQLIGAIDPNDKFVNGLLESKRIATGLLEIPAKSIGGEQHVSLIKQLIALKRASPEETLSEAFDQAFAFRPSLQLAIFNYKNNPQNSGSQEGLKKEIAKFDKQNEAGKLYLELFSAMYPNDQFVQSLIR